MFNGEIALKDDYFVRHGDWIVVDGSPVRCNTYGSVGHLKREWSKQSRKDIRCICWCNKAMRKIGD